MRRQTGSPGPKQRSPWAKLVKSDQLALLAAYVLSPDAGVMTGALIDYDQTVVGGA